MFEVKVAAALGFCPGVQTAVTQAISYAKEYDRVYSLGTVAHNATVAKQLEANGVIPVDPYTAPAAKHVIVTAHGATPTVFDQIHRNECDVLDCTCPIVRSAQDTVEALGRDGYDVIIFGDHEHQEVRGLVGWGRGAVQFVGNHNQLFDGNQNVRVLGLRNKIAVVSQTTKAVEDYMDFVGSVAHFCGEKAKEIRVFNTICPVVTHRINQARQLAREVDLMLVIGSPNSANTQNLQRVSSPTRLNLRAGIPRALIIEDADDVQERIRLWFEQIPTSDFVLLLDKCVVGVTAGTSTPMTVVDAVVAKLKGMNDEG